jgi:hypothetical protein
VDENQVIKTLCAHYEMRGFMIEQRLHTTQQGVDIVARDVRSGRRYYVEAKGGTSSRQGSARFGSIYTQSQVFDRVAKAVLSGLRLRADHPDEPNEEVVLAFPDSKHFRKYLTPVVRQLNALAIKVVLILETGDVIELR